MNNPEVGVIPNTPDIPTQDANDFEAPEEPQIEIPIPTQPHTVPTQTHSSEPSIPTRKSTRSTTQPAWLKDFVIGKHRASMATKTKQPVYPLFHEKDFEAYPEEYVGSLAHVLANEDLHAINLGDSGFVVISDGCTIFHFPVQTDKNR
ncbi:protein phosphatase 2C family protein [Artemisia annua]|uniref:Protein phosphatase 2C family protein n=1 Tax=Artemisia annua TaxID=35608 RepID=A0A2U1MYS2_ARTAN|nr:protein phosphatase 2C family protein [Artemisia annua]